MGHPATVRPLDMIDDNGLHNVSSTTSFFSKKSDTEEVGWVSYLSKAIFKRICPVCRDSLDARHGAAHVGSCNFNGPNLSNGFLREVKTGQWDEVAKSFERLTSMDMMACEVLRCPRGLCLTVWVEVDLAIGGDQYLVYAERIDEYELSKIEQVTSLKWLSF